MADSEIPSGERAEEATTPSPSSPSRRQTQTSITPPPPPPVDGRRTPPLQKRASSTHTPPPSPPLRRTTTKLPERRLGSTSSIETTPQPDTAVEVEEKAENPKECSPPTTPDHPKTKLLQDTSPRERGLRRVDTKSIASRGSPTSINSQEPKPTATKSKARGKDIIQQKLPRASTNGANFPIPISPSDAHSDQSTVSEGKKTRSRMSTSSSTPPTSPTEKHPPPPISPSKRTSSIGKPSQAVSTSVKETQSGYKGRLWSDWHWQRHQDAQETDTTPEVVVSLPEKKGSLPPHPGSDSHTGEGDTASGVRGKLGKAAGWVEGKIGELGKKVQESMYYGGESGRGRRSREYNVGF